MSGARLGLRRLTDGERALAREVFGDGLRSDRIRILTIPIWPRAFVAGPGLIVWPAPLAQADLSAPGMSLDTQAVFVHELTHVWQAQNGVSLILGKLRAGDRPASYHYDLKDGPAFQALNIEQQAMVVEDAFRASRGGATPHAPEVYAAIQTAWRQA
jgi:hypothetical protein